MPRFLPHKPSFKVCLGEFFVEVVVREWIRFLGFESAERSRDQIMTKAKIRRDFDIGCRRRIRAFWIHDAMLSTASVLTRRLLFRRLVWHLGTASRTPCASLGISAQEHQLLI